MLIQKANEMLERNELLWLNDLERCLKSSGAKVITLFEHLVRVACV